MRQQLEVETAATGGGGGGGGGANSNNATKSHAVSAKLKEEFECPVCLEQMRPPKQIYSCSSTHLFCQRCCQVLSKSERLWCCPKCRENFALTPPIRNRLAERWAKKFFP